MIPQSKGKMFLAAERGHTETDWFRSYNTFQFGQYRNPNKEPFGNLYVLNNDTLAGGKSFSLQVEELSVVLVLPIVGAIDYSDSTGNKITLEVGQIQRFTTPAGATLSFKNPYADDPINFLQVWIKKEKGEAADSTETVYFDIEEKKNGLIELFATNTGDSRVYIGKIAGRQEVVHHVNQDKRTLFVYVLEGAFEVANRLLETGDALALWQTSEIEIEALSNDAIILMIEMEIPNSV